MIRLTSHQGIKRSFRPADIQVIVPKTILPGDARADTCKSSISMLASAPGQHHSVMETPEQIEALLLIAPRVLGRAMPGKGDNQYVTAVGIGDDGCLAFSTVELPDLPKEGSL